MFTIDIADNAVQAALQTLASRVANTQPVMQAIGEDIMARSKARFETSTGPDGVPWKANQPSTLARYLAQTSGNYKKSGDLSKKGAARLAGKKPLIGHSGDLRREFHVNAVVNAVTIGNTMKYAAMQQFGGTKAAFPHLWGNIPSRPFMPIKQNGELYPDEQARILATIRKYLAGE